VEYLKVKNWSEYQHYKDRCPPWIKLHTNILNDRAFSMLSLASRGLLMQLWVLASEHGGQVPNDLDEIKFRLRDNAIKQKDINLLIDRGFLNGRKQAQAGDSKRLSRGEERQRQSACKRKLSVCVDENVSMSDEELKKLIDKHGEPFALACVERLKNGKGAKGYKYESDYRAILTWVVRAVRDDGGPPVGQESNHKFR